MKQNGSSYSFTKAFSKAISDAKTSSILSLVRSGARISNAVSASVSEAATEAKQTPYNRRRSFLFGSQNEIRKSVSAVSAVLSQWSYFSSFSCTFLFISIYDIHEDGFFPLSILLHVFVYYQQIGQEDGETFEGMILIRISICSKR
jgi:hypothetical protein